MNGYKRYFGMRVLRVIVLVAVCCGCFFSGMAKTDAEQFNEYKRLAEQGNAAAQCNLGVCYFNGLLGMPKDQNEAVIWFIRSANKGFANAQYNLGVCYEKGITMAVNYSKAYEWYTKAAEQGLADAQNNLGICYYYGRGVMKNYGKAVKWFTEAANQGHAKAQCNLGDCYRYGYGVNKDLTAAADWYSKAAEQGNQSARDVLAEIGKENTSDSPSPQNDVAENAVKREETVAVKKNEPAVKRDIVDTDIPVNVGGNDGTFAFIIGNENYEMVEKVPFAVNDATVFAEYCKKTLGLPEPNVELVTDATAAKIHSVVRRVKEIALAFQGDVNIIFYYAGHGVPDEKSKNAYLLPVDVESTMTDFCYGIDKLYTELGGAGAKSVVVFLDACFSGSQRGEGMLASARGVALKPKEAEPVGNMVVFSAADGEQTAYPYEAKGHGMFTYFLLDKLRSTKGDVTLQELGDYVSKKVRQQSVVVNRKSQTPTITPSATMRNWGSLKLR